MSEESKSDRKSKSSRSRFSSSGSSNSYSSKSYSSRSSSSSKSKSSNSIKDSKDKNLVDGFVSSLFDDIVDKEKESNQQEEKVVEGFISSLFDEEEKNGQKSKKGSQKKKVAKNNQKNNVIKKVNKTQKNTYKNANNNSKLYSTNKKLNMQNNNRNYATTRDIGHTTKRKEKDSLKGDINNNQHKRTKTPDNIRKINPKLNMGKYKKSRDITPICTINKKERKNHSVQKRIVAANDSQKRSKHLNRTLDYQSTEMSKQYKAKIESDKEKKEYEEKIRLMKNHISAMKRQQEDMNKKINFLKHKEDNINNIKKERENEKKAILEYNINKKTELAEKRKHIEKQREMMNKQIKESSEKAKMEKINKYKQSKKEKLEASNKINISNQNKIQNQIKKIKVLRENNKNIALNRQKKLNKNYNDLYEEKYEKNLEKTQMLKLEMKKLQDEEDELINKLNKTREKLNTFNSNENIYFYIKKSRKESV